MHVTSIVNGVDLDRLSGTIDAVTADPALARFQFRAGNHWIDGGHSRTTIKGFYGAGQEDATRTQPFTVDSDEPPVLLGQNRAPNAGEFLLHALAACLTGTIVYHAAARGIALEGLECTIQGDLDLHGFLGLDSNVRPGYEQIQVTITAAGDFDDNQFAELASLTRYSPVRDIVSNPVPGLRPGSRGFLSTISRGRRERLPHPVTERRGFTYEPKLAKRLSTRRVRLARMILIQAIRNAVVNDLAVRNVAYRGHCAGPAVREQGNDRRRPNLTR